MIAQNNVEQMCNQCIIDDRHQNIINHTTLATTLAHVVKDTIYDVVYDPFPTWMDITKLQIGRHIAEWK